MKPSVNLPRWGLKPNPNCKPDDNPECKFTPLGFETICIVLIDEVIISVNLPRWGLKLYKPKPAKGFLGCKFTPLGFETTNSSIARVAGAAV